MDNAYFSISSVKMVSEDSIKRPLKVYPMCADMDELYSRMTVEGSNSVGSDCDKEFQEIAVP